MFVLDSFTGLLWPEGTFVLSLCSLHSSVKVIKWADMSDFSPVLGFNTHKCTKRKGVNVKNNVASYQRGTPMGKQVSSVKK